MISFNEDSDCFYGSYFIPFCFFLHRIEKKKNWEGDDEERMLQVHPTGRVSCSPPVTIKLRMRYLKMFEFNLSSNCFMKPSSLRFHLVERFDELARLVQSHLENPFHDALHNPQKIRWQTRNGLFVLIRIETALFFGVLWKFRHDSVNFSVKSAVQWENLKSDSQMEKRFASAVIKKGLCNLFTKAMSLPRKSIAVECSANSRDSRTLWKIMSTSVA